MSYLANMVPQTKTICLQSKRIIVVIPLSLYVILAILGLLNQVNLPRLKPLYKSNVRSATGLYRSFAPLAELEWGDMSNNNSNTSVSTHEPECSPKQKIVFIKTHKTASTTTASIFERYGYYRNLTFVTGKRHVLSFAGKFNRKNVLPFPKMKKKTFDILANHARYDRKEMSLLIPNAVYITILRKPEEQLESAFGYFEMYKTINKTDGETPLEAYMNDPKKYWKKLKMWQLSRNGQLFDLGFEHEFDEDGVKLEGAIQDLDEELDLVLISEYYDESLILLRKLLCWDYEDILYISAGVRSSSHRFQKSDELIAKIKKWNHGDVLLYDHFNRTFWKKVDAYGKDFQRDLNFFRRLNQEVFDQCIDSKKLDRKDTREDKFVLKNNTERCTRILRADIGYTKLIRTYMKRKYG
ncbi:galactosylceramide sulfotransferase-like isoform X1 [Apostichopus japonicus]|uniref:galactosylceramide sulfotransferase-like isoform X1 n=2 Tax=Stichopus japonicus TaxID=307972 RepID=UPI003AB8F786